MELIKENECALFIDLNKFKSIEDAISFKHEAEFNDFVNTSIEKNLKYNVGIKHTDGEVIALRFFELALYFNYGSYNLFIDTGLNCAICGSKDADHVSPFSYSKVCRKHIPYHLTYNVEILQKELGIISELPDYLKKCTICKCDLTPEEISSISRTDIQITCNKHAEVKKIHQTNLAIIWFDYKALNPTADIYNQTDLINFNKWRMSLDKYNGFLKND